MSETKTRTFEDVQMEYSQLALRAGSLQYEIHVKSKDLEMLNDSMRKLNMEAAKLQAKAVLDQQKASEPKLEGVV